MFRVPDCLVFSFALFPGFRVLSLDGNIGFGLAATLAAVCAWFGFIARK